MYDACAHLGLPAIPNGLAVFETLNSTLSTIFNETIEWDSSVAGAERALLADIFCSSNRVGNTCYGICPNPDLAGIGVRLAFYLQAALNALLVAVSPEDSPGAAWGATLLVSAVVIPAWVQKKQGQLSLYHATLVLNFATLSSLASLAVAPLCPIWREKGMSIPLQQRLHEQLDGRQQVPPESSPLFDVSSPLQPEFANELSDVSDDEHSVVGGEHDQARGEEDDDAAEQPPSRRKDVTYQRIVLSFALLAQVALQWSYAVLLFTSPYYAELSCSKHTVVALFGIPLQAIDLNGKYFGLWVFWLAFNMTVTFAWGVFLVVSGSVKAQDEERQPDDDADLPTRLYYGIYLLKRLIRDGPLRRRVVMASALAFALGFLANAEVQQTYNCFVSDAENSEWGFGQVAAVLLVFVPIWQLIVVANNRWFGGVRSKIVLRGPEQAGAFTGSPDRMSARLSEDTGVLGTPDGSEQGLLLQPPRSLADIPASPPEGMSSSLRTPPTRNRRIGY
ncbi:hypothetical protein BKA62DRAFT_774107 [Auriculariales sp. MPI-PUGE-AT-0066]|nr:hypothetical protein BKA62DRAFT_774107 [Auriculariales sp. MPI-PUGE-AT-0066]